MGTRKTLFPPTKGYESFSKLATAVYLPISLEVIVVIYTQD